MLTWQVYNNKELTGGFIKNTLSIHRVDGEDPKTVKVSLWFGSTAHTVLRPALFNNTVKIFLDGKVVYEAPSIEEPVEIVIDGTSTDLSLSCCYEVRSEYEYVKWLESNCF